MFTYEQLNEQPTLQAHKAHGDARELQAIHLLQL